MPRSHPPTLIRIARRTLLEECGLARGDRILVATSGGPDSSALLHVLSIVGPKLGFGVAAHGIDHGLRETAHAELDLAQALADDCGVAFTRATVDVKPGGNLQARARDARLRALERAQRDHQCGVIATAHHADDRAETVLLRLLRGAGTRGLRVLPPRDGDRIRPLIRATRADIVRHLSRHRIATAEDPSNQDRRFLRVRVRHELLPLLRNLSPGVVGHLNALADELTEGPPPALSDEAGRPVPLSRAHITMIRRASKLKRKQALIRLPAGQAVRVDPSTGGLELVAVPETRRRRDKGGAKRRKSG